VTVRTVAYRKPKLGVRLGGGGVPPAPRLAGPLSGPATDFESAIPVAQVGFFPAGLKKGKQNRALMSACQRCRLRFDHFV
jgi:hypothetical protein